MVSLPLVDHLPLVDTLCLEVGMVGVGLDMVAELGFRNTMVVLVVQGIVVVVGLQ